MTHLSSGRRKRIGKPEFQNTAFLFAVAGRLYTIEKDGSLYRINPRDGIWAGVGPAGGWKDTLAGVILRGKLYTVEPTGYLWATGLDPGRWKQVGKPAFGNTAFIFAAVGRLYTIENDGSLYGVSVG